MLELWQRIGLLDGLGADHVFPAKRVAIGAIFERLDRGICARCAVRGARCAVRMFEECKTLPTPLTAGG